MLVFPLGLMPCTASGCVGTKVAVLSVLLYWIWKEVRKMIPKSARCLFCNCLGTKKNPISRHHIIPKLIKTFNNTETVYLCKKCHDIITCWNNAIFVQLNILNPLPQNYIIPRNPTIKLLAHQLWANLKRHLKLLF